MAYRYDEDLEFLSECENDDLDILVGYLTSKGEGLTEELTLTDAYKRYYPNHKMYWKEIAEEIQKFGGNTFVNIFRGTGVCYREVLTDVCDKMKVNYNANSNIDIIEQNLMLKILEQSIDEMNDEQLRELVSELNLKVTNVSKQAIMAAVQILIKKGGFLSYQILVIIANIVARQVLGHGLKLATNATLTKAMSIFAGPIGWIVTAAWTALDIAGPAFRITIPVCIQIAYMRYKRQMN